MRNHWALALSILGLAVQAGCSYFPGRSTLTQLGLPSPDATIAATERKGSSKPSTRPVKAGKESPTAKAQKSELTADLARGEQLEHANDHKKARKVYEEILKRDPENAQAIRALGVIADKQGRHGEAEQRFLMALQQEPRDPQLLNDLGYCYFMQGHLSKAEAAMVKATTLEPTSACFHTNLGLVLGYQKRYEEAFAEFSKAGSEADAFYNMAPIFAMQGLVAEAKGCYQQALEADPSYHAAREQLASLEEFERDPADMQKQESSLTGTDGVRLVPYIEGNGSGAGADGNGVRQASGSFPAGDIPASRNAGRSTRDLQLQSRGLLGRHMNSQRTMEKSAGK